MNLTEPNKKERRRFFFHYQYSLTSEQQSRLQVFLRLLPEAYRRLPEWKLLHEVSYSEDSSTEAKYSLISEEEDNDEEQ